MAQLTISQVARRIRLRPSAIRYYERIGLLPPCGWRIVISPIFPQDPKFNVTLLHCAQKLPVLRKKSVRDEFVNKNLRETLDCSH